MTLSSNNSDDDSEDEALLKSPSPRRATPHHHSSSFGGRGHRNLTGGGITPNAETSQWDSDDGVGGIFVCFSTDKTGNGDFCMAIKNMQRGTVKAERV